MPGVPEDTTEAAVAAVYAEYRASTGLSRTPLLLRELALQGPEVLTAVWAMLRPHYAGSELHVARRRLFVGLTPPQLELMRTDIAGASQDAADLLLRRLHVTLRLFADANATNLIIVHMIAQGGSTGQADAGSAGAGQVGAGSAETGDRGHRVPALPLLSAPEARTDDVLPLPLPEPEDLAPEVAEQVLNIAGLIVDDAPRGWWPSLLLHLAPFPQVLDAIERSVTAHAPSLRALATELEARAAVLAAELVAGATRSAVLDADARTAADTLAARYLRVLPSFAALAACPLLIVASTDDDEGHGCSGGHG